MATIQPTMSAETIRDCLKEIDPKVIVTESCLLKKANQALSLLGKTVELVCMDESNPGGNSWIGIEAAGKDSPGLGSDLVRSVSKDPALIMYTSGTTAAAKGVVMTQEQILCLK